MARESVLKIIWVMISEKKDLWSELARIMSDGYLFNIFCYFSNHRTVMCLQQVSEDDGS